jgi:regulator of protease activity HflC (stomatin/prohibitin superfamily)
VDEIDVNNPNPGEPEDQGGIKDQAGIEPGARAASVRLRDAESTRSAADRRRMDAANQSLADALRITYNLLRVSMVVLIVLFVFSGVQSINEGERGIALRFGKPVRANLEPGFQWSFPYPIGEIVRVQEGATELPIAQAFMPNLPGDDTEEQALEADIDRFNSGSALKPGTDGSNITADLNIAHTQWNVNFHRSDHTKAVEHIHPAQEREMIKAIVQRSAVHVLAQTPIDDLLRQSSESISGAVRTIAQRELDQLDSGITIDRVVLTRKSAAMSLRRKFSSVQTAAQNAGKAREDALLTRDQMLNEVAGRASGLLIELIDEYERLVELGDDDAAAAQLETIDAVLEGRDVEVNGRSVQGLVSGEVAEMLNQARTSASNRVSQAIADREFYRSKLEQYAANPRLMIARDWSSAMTEFMARDFVSTIMLPEGVSAEMFINNDPDIARELDRQRKRREAQEARDERFEQMRDAAYRTRRGIQEPED